MVVLGRDRFTKREGTVALGALKLVGITRVLLLRGLHRGQSNGVAKVRDQVTAVLNSDREADESRRHGLHFGGDTSVGHLSRDFGQRTAGTKAYGVLEELEVLDHLLGNFSRAHLEAKECTTTGSLFKVSLGLVDPVWVAVTTFAVLEHRVNVELLIVERLEVVYANHVRVAHKELVHRQRVLLGFPHAKCHRLNSSEHEKAVERCKTASLRILHKIDLLGKLRVPHCNDACHHV
mmetsp:Transcript_14556/g.28162  ORF Transcript_14556/g.28162 Transcript_14556/m.28162 type:complete len:235 (-) Transcript_14556:988-1692(-)